MTHVTLFTYLKRMAEALEERHDRELEELQARCDAHVEAARAAGGKGKKAKVLLEAAEREAEQWRYEVNERHQAELEEAEGSATPAAAAEPAQPVVTAARSPEEDEAERARRKKEKAQKKRDGKASKEAEHEEEKERERREAGPSARALELVALATQLAKCSPPLRVLEVAADGHCLYRAVGHQLRCVRPELHEWKRPAAEVHEEVRALCAGALRKRPEDYSPFAELKDSEDFGAYCDRVERSGDWGGELELRALADELRVRIRVHRAGESGPLELGRAAAGGPLQVTYHEHYYALGEHYNSVAPIDGK